VSLREKTAKNNQNLTLKHRPSPEKERVFVVGHPCDKNLAHLLQFPTVDPFDNVFHFPRIVFEIVELVIIDRVVDILGVIRSYHALPEGELVAEMLRHEVILLSFLTQNIIR
jgi:hypothetical protein